MTRTLGSESVMTLISSQILLGKQRSGNHVGENGRTRVIAQTRQVCAQVQAAVATSAYGNRNQGQITGSDFIADLRR